MLIFFSFMLISFSEIVFYGVQKRKRKHVFRKIEIIRKWHIVSSVVKKRNLVDFSISSCKQTMLSKVRSQKFNIARLRVLKFSKQNVWA